MPVYKKIALNPKTTIFIWEITEELEQLQNVFLTDKNQQRLLKMKSENHEKAFLAVRHLFDYIGIKDSEVIYDDFGKPHLQNGQFISITHSFQYCGVIISDKPVGIDIEKQREKIIKIAHKFTDVANFQTETKAELIRKLTVIWGAKESIFKIYGNNLAFKNIIIDDFNVENKKTNGTILSDNKKYKIHFFSFDDFVCVYSFENFVSTL